MRQSTNHAPLRAIRIGTASAARVPGPPPAIPVHCVWSDLDYCLVAALDHARRTKSPLRLRDMCFFFTVALRTNAIHHTAPRTRDRPAFAALLFSHPIARFTALPLPPQRNTRRKPPPPRSILSIFPPVDVRAAALLLLYCIHASQPVLAVDGPPDSNTNLNPIPVRISPDQYASLLGFARRLLQPAALEASRCLSANETFNLCDFLLGNTHNHSNRKDTVESHKAHVTIAAMKQSIMPPITTIVPTHDLIHVLKYFLLPLSDNSAALEVSAQTLIDYIDPELISGSPLDTNHSSEFALEKDKSLFLDDQSRSVLFNSQTIEKINVLYAKYESQNIPDITS